MKSSAGVISGNDVTPSIDRRASKIFVEKSTSEPKVKAYIPMYDPLEVVRCKKCGRVLAEPKTLIRIVGTGK